MKKRTLKGFLMGMLICFLFAGFMQYCSAEDIAAASKRGYVLENGQYYFYNQKGKLVKGWLENKSGKYYFDRKTGAAKEGILLVDGSYYCFNKKGKMQTGWQVINGKRYLFNKQTGKMYIGWYRQTNGREYYFFEDGAVRKGWQKVDGRLYYFSSYGLKVKNKIITVGKRKFYLDNNGQRYRGIFQVDGKRYIALKTTGALVINDWYTDEDGYKYHTDESGVLITGFYKPDTLYRYFEPKSGKMLTGWQNIGKYRYYFHKKTGGMFANRKMTLNQKMYYFTGNGKLYQKRFFTKSGITYYANKNGVLATGFVTIDGNKYFFDAEGARKTKWVNIDGKKYYFDPTTGIMQTNKWITKNYYVGADGAWIKGYVDYGFRWPLDDKYNWISSYFGPRTPPGPGASSYHKGIDIACKTESVNKKPIYAVADGTVRLVSPDGQSGGAGNYTQIDHGNGVISGYMHQSAFAKGLKEGLKVKKGQLIGYVGNTGISFGPHLHFEVIVNGEHKDPLNYLTVPKA